ncbi:MAG: phosphoribosylanthranilate isomerase [Aquificaceae bacterium]
MVKIKLCGFTREEDIIKAIELGVDYIGIVLYNKSPRYVPWEKIKELIEVAKEVKKVAVMVNPTRDEVIKALELGFDFVQLHGEESIDFAKVFGLDKIIKAFRTCSGLEVDKGWKKAHGILLDACSSYGGSGQLSNWDFAKDLVEKGYRVFLAGGLRPENVKQAIREVGPYAVDVSSGIEKTPGVKDHKKMEEFVHAVKNSFKD